MFRLLLLPRRALVSSLALLLDRLVLKRRCGLDLLVWLDWLLRFSEVVDEGWGMGGV